MQQRQIYLPGYDTEAASNKAGPSGCCPPPGDDSVSVNMGFDAVHMAIDTVGHSLGALERAVALLHDEGR